MKKYGGTRYNSEWDWFTWTILGLTAALCCWPIFIDFEIGPLIVSLWSFAFILFCMLGIYYKIDGDQLIVYQLFIPTALPISKIANIKPTNTWLSGPAASATHRIAISFTDRKVLRSTGPLVISPVRKKEFVEQLLAINPAIKVEL